MTSPTSTSGCAQRNSVRLRSSEQMIRPALLVSTMIVGSLWAAAMLHGQDHIATLPDHKLTPGAVRTTVADVCGDPHTAQYRHWSRERDDSILREYSLPVGPHRDYEVDHLLSLGLGGADTNNNLWAE